MPHNKAFTAQESNHVPKYMSTQRHVHKRQNKHKLNNKYVQDNTYKTILDINCNTNQTTWVISSETVCLI